MSFLIAGVLLNRRRERLERRRAALSDLVAPPMEHPILGLGGRSIELSRAQGMPISPDTVILAADALRYEVQRLRHEPQVLVGDLRPVRQSAEFLADAAFEVELSDEVRHSIAEDVASIVRME